MQFTTDISGLPSEVRLALMREYANEDQVRYATGAVEQLRAKRLADAAAVTGMNQEFGRRQMVLSPDQWNRCMTRYGQKCFMDGDFVPFLLRRHDDFRVKDVGTRPQSGYTGRGDSLKRESLNRESVKPTLNPQPT